MIAASEIGVSITRCSPYFAIRPSVTLNAPPYAPMSSPRQNTFSSRSISSNSASRIASRYVTSDIVRSPARRTLMCLYRRLDPFSEPESRHCGRLSVDPDQGISRVWHRRCLSLVGRFVNLVFYPCVDRGKLRLVKAFAQQLLQISIDRIVFRCPAV